MACALLGTFKEIPHLGVAYPVRRRPYKAGALPALNVKVRGIPHLAKNERDVGHPGVAAEKRFKASGSVREALWQRARRSYDPWSRVGRQCGQGLR